MSDAIEKSISSIVERFGVRFDELFESQKAKLIDDLKEQIKTDLADKMKPKTEYEVAKFTVEQAISVKQLATTKFKKLNTYACTGGSSGFNVIPTTYMCKDDGSEQCTFQQGETVINAKFHSWPRDDTKCVALLTNYGTLIAFWEHHHYFVYKGSHKLQQPLLKVFSDSFDLCFRNFSHGQINTLEKSNHHFYAQYTTNDGRTRRQGGGSENYYKINHFINMLSEWQTNYKSLPVENSLIPSF